MPRGGGGGFRGGGFSGGGFRGGGFRGGPTGFRMGSSRSSGTPFGRTGARRVTSRAPSGPYRHSSYGYRRRYYGYRPWYRHWWYSPYWAGRWYRPWYYSPVYVGGGVTIAIVLGLILLPLFGVAMWFPFSNSDANGTVNYRSTETLYFNEYWYEHENIEAGNDITYFIDSTPSLISFAIWDRPFESLPTTTRVGSDSDQLSLINNEYKYVGYYLKPGSTLNYDFNVSSQVDFFIASGQALYDWNQGGSPSFYVDENDVLSATGVYNVLSARDYYIVWFNEGVSTAVVNFTIDYSAADVIDLSAADFYIEGVDSIPENTFTVTSDGLWYFFVYFDPMISPEESTTITFDVTYDTGITSTERWLDLSPILIIIIIVIGIVIVAALFARRGQKKLKPKQSSKVAPAKSAKVASAKSAIKKSSISDSNCIRCGNSLRPDAHFCPKCGGKVDGRNIKESTIITPKKSKTCSFCRSKLAIDDKFCKWCGTEIGAT
ncbi:MAG: double zinc ribbon domain-containing protein [Promethearchaeota archaeon]